MWFKEYLKVIANKSQLPRVVRFRLRGSQHYMTGIVVPDLKNTTADKISVEFITDKPVPNYEDIWVVYSWNIELLVRTMINMCSYAEDFRGDI